ncbi:MAG: hypothetical protein ABIW31_04625 [Novosphingobium sp.]
MNRTLFGALAALLLAAAGLFWWQGRAETDVGKAPQQLADVPSAENLPGETGDGLRGAAPPEVNEATKEQRRFDRFDKNRDSKITRTEALMPRVAMFRKLDTDGNNLLSFEEWAVRTTNKFKAADRNGDGTLDRPEFATTKQVNKGKPQCKCERPAKSAAKRGKIQPPEPAPEPADLSDDGLSPGN